ncbi:Fatty acid synthase [Halotydeus destructor]|nr:Fatty acid synthase [Halotydeus destructor]
MSSIVDKFAALTQDTGSQHVAQRPLWLSMSPIGCYSPGMAKSLREIPVFAESIERSSNILEEVHIDLTAILYDESLQSVNFVEQLVSILAVEMALVDVLYAVGLKPDHIVGHSLGELGAGYADGATDARQALLSAYHFAAIPYAKYGGKGALAVVVGLAKEEVKQRCPTGVHVACSNGPRHVAIAGLEGDMKLFSSQLQAEGIIVVPVETGRLPLHTPIIEDTRRDIEAACAPLYRCPKKRSSRFLCTSIPQKQWSTASPYFDGKFIANVMIEEVWYYEVTSLIPEDAIVVDVGPDCMAVKVLKQQVGPGVTLVPLLQANNNGHNLDLFIFGLASIHNSGHKLDIHKLFAN